MYTYSMYMYVHSSRAKMWVCTHTYTNAKRVVGNGKRLIPITFRNSTKETCRIMFTQFVWKTHTRLRHLRTRMVEKNTHCNTLQHTAAHYNTLRHTATHCDTLQHTANTATHCNTLPSREIHTRHTALLCRDLRRGPATHCDTLRHTATHCNTLQHTALQIHTQRDTQLCSAEMYEGDLIVCGWQKKIWRDPLQHTATHWHAETYRRDPRQHTATHCNTL